MRERAQDRLVRGVARLCTRKLLGDLAFKVFALYYQYIQRAVAVQHSLWSSDVQNQNIQRNFWN